MRSNNSISSAVSKGYGSDAIVDYNLSKKYEGMGRRSTLSSTVTVTPTLAGKKRKVRKHKPKDYPKRPLSAYNVFFKETRCKILQEHGKTNFQEMVRKISALWKEVTPEDKAKFDAAASKDLTRYHEEVDIYEQNVKIENNLISEKKRKIEQIQQFDTTNECEHVVTVCSDDSPSSAVDAKSDNGKNDYCFPVKNVRVPNIAQDASIVETGQKLPGSKQSALILTSTELQLAHHRLEEEVVTIDDAISVQKRQSKMCGGNAFTVAVPALVGDIYGMRNPAVTKLTPTALEIQRQGFPDTWCGGGLGLGILEGKTAAINSESVTSELVAGIAGDTRITSDEVVLRKRLDLGMDTMATIKALETRKRLADLDAYIAVASNEIKLRKQLSLGKNSMPSLSQTIDLEKAQRLLKLEAEQSLARSKFSAGRDFVPAPSELELRIRLGLSTSGATNSQMLAFRAAEIRNNLGIGKRPSIISTGGEMRTQMLMALAQTQLSASEAGLRERLVMHRKQDLLDHSRSRAIGIGNIYEETLLRGQMIRKQELLRMTQLSRGTSPSLYGGPS